MSATNPPPPEGPNHLADELPLLLADAMWAYESRADLTVLNGLTEAVRAAAGDPLLARAAGLLHWGRAEDFEDEEYDGDESNSAQIRLAIALAEAVAAGEGDLGARAGALERLADLRIQTGGAAGTMTTFMELAEVRARLAAADPGELPALAAVLVRLARSCKWAARSCEDEAEKAWHLSTAAVYQLRAAEVYGSLTAAGTHVGELVEATRQAARFIEDADGPEAAVAVSAEGMRLAELHAAGLEPEERLLQAESAIESHAGVLMRAGRRDAALRHSLRRLGLHDRPDAERPDAERHARALRAHAVLLRDAGFPETAIPVLERAVDLLVGAETGASFSPLHLAFGYNSELYEAHEGLGEDEAALRRSERAVAIRERLCDLDRRSHAARLYRDAVKAHQARLAERDLDDEPVAFTHRVVAVFERIDTEGRPNTELADLLCEKLCELDRRGLYTEALALGSREIPIREAAATALEPNPDLARALNNRGLVYGRLGRDAEAVEDFERAVELHEAVAAAATDDGFAAQRLSEALYNHGRSLKRLRRYQAAAAALRRCVELREQLAEADPERSPTELADPLDLLANVFHESRDFTASFDARRRAEDAYARLPESDADRPWHLAQVRSGFAATCVQAHRDLEALETGREVVESFEELYAADPGRARSDLARSLRNLCIALKRAGLLDEQVTIAERALALQEQVHQEDPEHDLDDLADAFDRYSLALNEVGRTADAAEPAVRACELADRLLETDRGRHLDDVVRLMDNAASTLADADRGEEALALSRRALDLARELAAADTPSGLRYLATSLLNHGNRLSERELKEEALAVAEEGVAVGAAADAAEPGLHHTVHAKALVNLGRRLRALDRVDEAVAASARAIDLLEPLSGPGGTPDLELLETLAIAHGNQASDHEVAERLAESEAAGGRAVVVLERLAAVGHRPTVIPELRNQVSWHAYRLAGVERHAEAVARSEYALELSREIGDPEDVDHRRIDLAEHLQTLAGTLGDRRAAFAAEERSMDLVREFYSGAPDRDEEHLCGALLDWTWALGLVGRFTEALDASFETAAAVERRYGGEPGLNHWQALALDNIATSLGAVGRTAEALDGQRRATAAWETRLADKDTPSRRADVAWSLRFEACWMAESGADPQETAAVSARAVALYREAAAVLPDQRADAAITAAEHAVHLAAAGSPAEAVAMADEAARTLEALAAADPAERPELAAAQRHRARVHAADDRDDALAIALRSAAIWSRLAEELPLAFGFELALTLQLVAELRLPHAPAEATGFAERAVALMATAERDEPGAFADRLAEAESTLDRCRAAAPRRPIPNQDEEDDPKGKPLNVNLA
ncbi:tetratricopeptide repeat protein [Glycomyces paridis]|uniref:Tetratricopeptide repeat protein n=1 Tax=Glycomyces paridis TaxID=2126555 RepID=A0A4S8PED3_9ACTN|nr:tetratricopeptide repeat protein [Glycomyces paridis]THV28720.1 tetratricopeptide repeat protein [Glycomyces paridis]